MGWQDLSRYDGYVKVPQIYSVYATNLLAAASTEVSITVREMGTWVMTVAQVFVHKYQDSTTAGYVKLQLTDHGKNHPIMDQAIPHLALSPLAKEVPWIVPYEFSGNTNIGVQLISMDANAIDVWVALFGFHLYNDAGAPVVP